MARTKRKVNHLLPVTAAEAPKQRVYRTGGYVRLSVEDSGRHGADTIDMQRELILGYIAGQPDMELVDLYCDNGRTGTNFERPAFERLMEDVRTGKIDCIVVKDLSRFGRNYKETGNYLERIFPYLDVRFIAVNDNFDTLTAERSEDGYIIPLKNIMNEVYSRDISRKSSSALATKQRRGEFIGSWAPYGYQKCADDHHYLEPNVETAPVVQMIFQWRLSGMSYPQIARQLNEKNIPSPSKLHYLKGEVKAERFATSVWHVAVIKKILSSEIYLGHMVQGKTRNNLAQGQKLCPVPKSDWVIVRNTHTAIIDEGTFQAVQDMTENCRAVYKERVGKFDALGTIPNIFKGLIFCADCKCPMVRYKNVSPKCGNRYYTYICRTRAENLSSCSKKNFHETKLKEILWDLLQCEISLAGDLAELVRQYNHSAGAVSRENTLKREIASAQQVLDRAEMLHDSLFQSYHDKLMTEQEYTEMRTHYRAEMEQAKLRLAELEQPLCVIRMNTAH
ncbi:MAG: recombinase family protein [Oscillospiraceae bacterium]|nr:recombinase family protein [Oscillospiraceae bacterium]